MKCIRLCVQRGITSNTDKSSTNLILRCQFFARELTKIANSIGPSLVPCGIPPLIGLNLDVVLFIRTHCERCVRKYLIHLTRAGWISSLFISKHSTLLSARSNPLLKPAKKARTEQFPLSSASRILCRKYTRA